MTQRCYTFPVTVLIAGDCSKSWRMHWKRLDHQAFFSIVVNGLPTGYWCSSGGCMSKSSWWRPCFLDNWGRETEHSNLEIDSKLNRQPVKTYKWRCDVFMSWQWAFIAPYSGAEICLFPSKGDSLQTNIPPSWILPKPKKDSLIFLTLASVQNLIHQIWFTT